MIRGLIQRYPFLSYVLLAYALTWSLTVPLALSSRGFIDVDVPHAAEMLAAFGPLVAALLVMKVLRGAAGVTKILRGMLHWRVPKVWLLFSCLSPFLLLVIAVAISWVSTGQQPQFVTEKSLHYLTAIGLFELVVVGGMVQGFGEEPGWRGFAIPWLRKSRGPLLASLVLFPFWMFWHLPQFLSRPEFGIVQFMGFGLGILSATIWLTLIHDKTQSILMAAIWHTVVNVARNMALAISVPMFLTFNMLVTVGALAVVSYWVITRKQQGPLGDTLA